MAGSAGLKLPLSAKLVDAVSRWKEWLRSERRYSIHTLSGYDRELNSFLKFQLQHDDSIVELNLDDLANLKITDFRAYLADRNRGEVGERSKGLKPATLARALSAIRSFFRFCERQKLFANSAIHAIAYTKAPSRSAQTSERERSGDDPVGYCLGIRETLGSGAGFGGAYIVVRLRPTHFRGTGIERKSGSVRRFPDDPGQGRKGSGRAGAARSP